MAVINTTYPGAVAPPPGVTPDLDNPDESGNARTANVAGLSVCVALVTIMFAARVWVKLRITRTLLVEDITCVIAWIGIVLYAATCFMMARYGEGYHSWDLSVHDYAQMLKWLYASSVIYCPTAYFTKVTLLLLIARVFKVKTRVAYGVYTFIIVLLIAYLPIQVLKIIICLPIHSYWDADVDGHCFPQRKIFIADLSIAVITDLVILFLPIVLAWRLHFGWRKKVKISVLLGAGGIATGVTIYRMYVAIKFMKSEDVAGDFVLLDLLTITELTIGLVCACLPAVNILTAHHRISCFSHSSWAGSKTMSDDNRRRHIRWFGSTPQSPEPDSSNRSWGFKLSLRHSTPSETGTVPKSSQINFETELAMLAGTAVEEEQSPPHLPQSPDAAALQMQSPVPLQDQENWLTLSRANSRDGLREGWLHPGGRRQTVAIAEEIEGSDESQTTEISQELARVSGNRPWSRIWDGRCNSIS